MSEALSEEFLKSVPFKDQPAFSFYFDQTRSESLPVTPEYTWDQFEALGYAPFQETDIYNLAYLDELAEGDGKNDGLIPNYRQRVDDIPPMLSAFEGRPGEAIHHQMSMGKAAVLNASHPSLATPILVSRSAIETFGHDIRQNLYLVYGAWPTVFKYELGNKSLSPVGIARACGNTLITAALTPSNETDNSDVRDWQALQRDSFKRVFEEITAPKGPQEMGALIILCVTGQRIKNGPVLRPEGKLKYLMGTDVWSVGVDDRLLGPALISSVWMQVDPLPIPIIKSSDVHASNRRTCELASHGDTSYAYESYTQQTKRIVNRRRAAAKTKPEVLRLG